MAPSSGDMMENSVLSSEEASDYSTTNVMTDGVDESDVVKQTENISIWLRMDRYQ